MSCFDRHAGGEWYARLCVIFSYRSAAAATSFYVLVKYFEEEEDNLGTMMPRVHWATRQRHRTKVSWYDVVGAESVLRTVFLQPDYSRPKGVAYFVNLFAS